MKKFYLSIFFILCINLTSKSLNAHDFDQYGYYFGLFGGANFADQVRLGNVNTDVKTGYLLGGSIGLETCYGFRIEGEVTYRRNTLHKLKIRHFDISFDQPGHGALNSVSYMANVIYDFNDCFCFKPYLGLGLGYAHTNAELHVDQDGEFFKVTGHKNGFAWQAIAGVGYAVMECADLILEYRYYKPNVKRYNDHNLAAGFRFHF